MVYTHSLFRIKHGLHRVNVFNRKYTKEAFPKCGFLFSRLAFYKDLGVKERADIYYSEM